MGKVQFAWRPRLLTPLEQAVYQTNQIELQTPVTPIARADVRAVDVREIWFEEPVGEDWIVAYRLVFQDNETRVVVGEIRIFPSATGPREPLSGRWIAEVLGDRAPVPPGGIRARGVLRKVKLKGFQKELGQIFRKLNVGWTVTAPSTSSSSGKRRGRKPYPIEHYARAAVEYERAYIKGDARPTAHVLRALNLLTPAAARATVYRARRLGLLEETERGEGSGRATKKAHELVRARRARTPRSRRSR